MADRHEMKSCKAAVPVSEPAGLREWLTKNRWQREEPTDICEVLRARHGKHTIRLYDYSNFKDSDVDAVQALLASRSELKWLAAMFLPSRERVD